MSTSPMWPDDFATETYAYLTTIGRTSGKPHRIEIWFAAENGRIYMLSGGRDRSDWVKNLIANPVVTVEIGNEKRAGVAHSLKTGSVNDIRAREMLVEKYQKDTELLEWGSTSLGIVIQFASAKAVS